MEALGKERAGGELTALNPADCAAIVASPRWKTQPSGDCIIWTGHLNNQGYPTVKYKVARGLWRSRYAHRVALVAHLGRDLADGMVVDHICRTPACVNPEHLEEVTQRTNVDRGLSRRRSHCINGHAFDEANTYYRPDNGNRQCRTCIRQRNASRKKSAA